LLCLVIHVPWHALPMADPVMRIPLAPMQYGRRALRSQALRGLARAWRPSKTLGATIAPRFAAAVKETSVQHLVSKALTNADIDA